MRKEKLQTLSMILLEWVILLAGILGLIINFIKAPAVDDALSSFSYYTNQSSLIVVILVGIRIYYRIHKKEIPKIISLFTIASTSWLLATCLGFIFLLSAIYQPVGIKIISNILLHYLTPLLMLLYFFISKSKIKIKKSLSFFFISYPLLYGIVSLIRGAIFKVYPYWFLNPTKMYPDGIGSYGNVLIVLFVMVAFFIILGYLLLWLHIKVKGESIDR